MIYNLCLFYFRFENHGKFLHNQEIKGKIILDVYIFFNLKRKKYFLYFYMYFKTFSKKNMSCLFHIAILSIANLTKSKDLLNF